jgi:hypothetical protein
MPGKENFLPVLLVIIIIFQILFIIEVIAQKQHCSCTKFCFKARKNNNTIAS